MAAPARICVIRQGFYPLDPRVRRQVDALLLSGCEVEVICLLRAGERRYERLGRLSVHRIPIGKGRSGRIGYLIQYSAFHVVATLMAAAHGLRRRFDLVQVSTMPDSLVFAAVLPRLLGARVLLDLHECMPEFYAAKFGTGLKHPVVRLIAWIEQAAIRFADHAITCTDQMRDAFASRGAPVQKIQVIVNSADEAQFDPQGYGTATKAGGEFRIICHGTVEWMYGIDTIVRAVALLRNDLPHLRLDVYGEGSAVPEIRSLVSALGIGDQVTMAGRFVPIDELIQGIANADAGIVAIRRDVHRDLTHCNKMFDFIAMRKPAIVSRTRSVEAYFDESCFHMFAGGDEHDLARAIREVASDPHLRNRLVQNATRANERYRWPHERRRYQQIVENLMSRQSPAVSAEAGAREADRVGEA
jgi:glycosyltransferase involved in cell wall biosynthesis